jgi:indolepyruvate ferredoxin oxidoreductase
LADRYEALVRKSQASMAEKGISDEALLIKLAQNYFKLLAYKDEYEVARLYSDGSFKALLADQFEGDYKLKFHLAPPLIAPRDKHTGLPRKITFGGWMMPMFSLLAPLRILRGTALDPFGYTLDRRLERQQIKEYETLVEQCLAKLDTRNMATVTALIALPEQIRGFGHIKEQSMQRAKIAQDALLLQLDAKAEPVKLVDQRTA